MREEQGPKHRVLNGVMVVSLSSRCSLHAAGYDTGAAGGSMVMAGPSAFFEFSLSRSHLTVI